MKSRLELSFRSDFADPNWENFQNNCLPIFQVSSYFSDYSERNWIFCEKENFLVAMGGMMSYFRGLFGSREMRILILGLDGAGKTTLLYRLQVSCCIIFHVCLFSESWFSAQDWEVFQYHRLLNQWQFDNCKMTATQMLDNCFLTVWTDHCTAWQYFLTNA